MRIGIHMAVVGSSEQQKRLEVISNNIANAGTAGYKKDVVRFQNLLTETTLPDMDQGTIRNTGRPLDIALSGKGFLRVETPAGIQYTRSGNLSISRDGTLVTKEGWPVLGQGGPIQLPHTDVRIEPDGRIYDGNRLIDNIDLVEFPSGVGFMKSTNGYLKPSDLSQTPAPATGCAVHQGALEEANFSVIEEMAQMIESLRSFEAYQKTLQLFEQADAQITNKVGSPS